MWRKNRMVKDKSVYTTIPLKWETKKNWDKCFNQMKLDSDGVLKYQDDFISLLLQSYEKNQLDKEELTEYFLKVSEKKE